MLCNFRVGFSPVLHGGGNVKFRRKNCYVIFERPHSRCVDPVVDINIVTVCAFSTHTKTIVQPHLCKMSHFIVSLCLHINDIHI